MCAPHGSSQRNGLCVYGTPGGNRQKERLPKPDKRFCYIDALSSRCPPFRVSLPFGDVASVSLPNLAALACFCRRTAVHAWRVFAVRSETWCVIRGQQGGDNPLQWWGGWGTRIFTLLFLTLRLPIHGDAGTRRCMIFVTTLCVPQGTRQARGARNRLLRYFAGVGGERRMLRCFCLAVSRTVLLSFFSFLLIVSESASRPTSFFRLFRSHILASCCCGTPLNDVGSTGFTNISRLLFLTGCT